MIIHTGDATSAGCVPVALVGESLSPSNPHEELVMEQTIEKPEVIEVIELSLEDLAQIGGGYGAGLLL